MVTSCFKAYISLNAQVREIRVGSFVSLPKGFPIFLQVSVSCTAKVAAKYMIKLFHINRMTGSVEAIDPARTTGTHISKPYRISSGALFAQENSSRRTTTTTSIFTKRHFLLSRTQLKPCESQSSMKGPRTSMLIFINDATWRADVMRRALFSQNIVYFVRNTCS